MDNESRRTPFPPENIVRANNAIVEEAVCFSNATGYLVISYRAPGAGQNASLTRVRLNVDRNTILLGAMGRGISLCSIRTGMRVNAVFSSRMTRSIPPQANAFLITLRRPDRQETNVMAGRAGDYDPKTETWSDVIYMPCTKETGFAPELPGETPDIIYLCFPNNPTGSTITKDQLQEWVDYANKVGAVIIYDAAYEAYISEADVPHTIYECQGARTCAIELRSFSKNAGFTGVRLGATVIPKDLKSGDVMLHSLWARRHGTKYNGAPYIVQRAGEAVYSEAGKAQLKEQVAYYMRNAKTIYEGLKSAGYNVSGGVNAPYIWLETPKGMSSWEFFDYLLEHAGVVGTPGSGFGPSGEGYFRLTAFGSHENTKAAIRRIQEM